MWGISYGGPPSNLYSWQEEWTQEDRYEQLCNDLNDLRANWFRTNVIWGWIEPRIYEHVKVEDVTDEMVDNYLNDPNKNWEVFDDMVTHLSECGVNLILGIGIGYYWELPYNGNSNQKISPSLIGVDYYLGDVFLHARAVVRRYKDYVRYYQIENELNAAGETAFILKWRSNDPLWWNPQFIEMLISTLSYAVRLESQRSGIELYTLHNFAISLDYYNDILRLKDYLDIIGVDCYFNYILGLPELGWTVGLMVQVTKEILKNDSPYSIDNKEVWVLETGYPTAPMERLFSEETQAQYLEDAISSSLEAGAKGFFYFTITTSENNNLPWWELESVESHWGLIKPGLRYTSAWWVFYEFTHGLN